jgi:hypothetical protein
MNINGKVKDCCGMLPLHELSRTRAPAFLCHGHFVVLPSDLGLAGLGPRFMILGCELGYRAFGAKLL